MSVLGLNGRRSWPINQDESVAPAILHKVCCCLAIVEFRWSVLIVFGRTLSRIGAPEFLLSLLLSCIGVCNNL